jgi:hypothetical protein
MSLAAFVTAAGFTFAAPAHADNDVQQDCTAKEWPQPLPNAVGRQHDVLDDNSGYTRSWRITGQSPAEGTPVAENETVTFQVSR